MEFQDVVNKRQSIKRYVSDHDITDAELRRLFELTTRSPSSFNLQHWRFVVIRDRSVRARLREVCFGQEQAETASAVVVIAGKLDAHRDAPAIYADAPESVREMLLPMIERFYGSNAAAQREEAVRSGSLAAMTLMLAAEDMGYSTCPMVGFNPKALAPMAGLDDNYVPVMLVAVGKAAGGDRSPSGRLPLSEVVRLERLDGPGLT